MQGPRNHSLDGMGPGIKLPFFTFTSMTKDVTSHGKTYTNVLTFNGRKRQLALAIASQPLVIR